MTNKSNPASAEITLHDRGSLDLEIVLAKLHREHELINNAIEKLEQLPSRRKRGPGRPRTSGNY